MAVDYRASTRRLLLAGLIDLVFFIAIWTLLASWIEQIESLPFWVPFVLFFPLHLAAKKYLGSPGYVFLSINKQSVTVDRRIRDNENWLTMLLGFVFLLEGAKQLSRWTQTFVPVPYFGAIPDNEAQVALYIFIGLLYILTGYWLLTLNVKGIYLSLAMAGMLLASTIVSWDLWDTVAEQMVVSRREFQQMPVNNHEIEFMQSIFPEGIVVVTVLTMCCLLIVAKHCKNLTAHSPADRGLG